MDEYQELNKKTLELLEKQLEKGKKALVIAIIVDIDTSQYSQVVGYGVTIPLLEDAMWTSLAMLKLEIQRKQS